MSRQIALDTETTGLEISEGHRIIEIGCIEMVNRRITDRSFHTYLQPDMKIHGEALKVHGISNEFLQDKPRFADIVHEFIEFVTGAELIIHNAAFDVGFINHELELLPQKLGFPLGHYCSIVDTLELARRHHPGQRNSLDALCKRYAIDNSRRNLHGALLDARLLAEVYLALTSGQINLLTTDKNLQNQIHSSVKRVSPARKPLPVIQPSEAESQAHQQQLAMLDKASKGQCIWLTQDE